MDIHIVSRWRLGTLSTIIKGAGSLDAALKTFQEKWEGHSPFQAYYYEEGRRVNLPLPTPKRRTPPRRRKPPTN